MRRHDLLEEPRPSAGRRLGLEVPGLSAGAAAGEGLARGRAFLGRRYAAGSLAHRLMRAATAGRTPMAEAQQRYPPQVTRQAAQPQSAQPSHGPPGCGWCAAALLGKEKLLPKRIEPRQGITRFLF